MYIVWCWFYLCLSVFFATRNSHSKQTRVQLTRISKLFLAWNDSDYLISSTVIWARSNNHNTNALTFINWSVCGFILIKSHLYLFHKHLIHTLMQSHRYSLITSFEFEHFFFSPHFPTVRKCNWLENNNPLKQFWTNYLLLIVPHQFKRIIQYVAKRWASTSLNYNCQCYCNQWVFFWWLKVEKKHTHTHCNHHR